MYDSINTFRQIHPGYWRHDACQVSVVIHEDTRRSFRGYRNGWPTRDALVRNAAGNPMRFRTADSAAAYLLRERAAEETMR